MKKNMKVGRTDNRKEIKRKRRIKKKNGKKGGERGNEGKITIAKNRGRMWKGR